MEKIDWCDAYCVAIKEIDEDKRILVDHINRLIDVNNGTDTSVDMVDALMAVIDCARDYFRKEERCLAEFHYPELDAHKREHKGFLKKMGGFRRRFTEDPDRLTSDIVTYLREWVVSHTCESDLKYAPFVRLQKYLSTCGKGKVCL